MLIENQLFLKPQYPSLKVSATFPCFNMDGKLTLVEITVKIRRD